MRSSSTTTRHGVAPASDQDFDALVEAHRRMLHAHCYRMLASLHDADDALQETLLRAWKGLDRFDGRSSVRTWLHTIATNVCLRAVERRQRQLLPIDTGPGSTVSTASWERLDVWPDPYPTGGADGPEDVALRSETLGLAFVAAAQLLPPSQRAVLLLREVHGYSARETATMLDLSAAAVNSSLQRARRTLAEHPALRSHPSDQLEPAQRGQLAHQYVDAWETGDLQAVLDLLTADATFQMPPMATWFDGRAAIAEFLPTGPLRDVWRMVPTEANGQLAFGCFAWDAGVQRFEGHSLDVVSVAHGQINGITSFLLPQLLPHFGLPSRLDLTRDTAPPP